VLVWRRRGDGPGLREFIRVARSDLSQAA
jgi:hypothetical protein